MNDRKRPTARELSRSTFLRVCGPAPVTFRVDPAGPQRAMAQGVHASLTHLERSVPEPVRGALPALCRAITEGKSREHASLAAIDALVRHGLVVDRRDEPRSSIRKHPAGRLTQEGGHHLVDHELLGLGLGLRTVAKRMCVPGRAAERASRFRELGLVASWFGVTTHGALSAEREVILVANDQAAVDHAARVEQALLEAARDRADDASVVREMGALLGYPSCCVERFVLLRARDDASLAGALLGPLGAPTPFETAFTVPPFTLVSHAPCSPTCDATRRLVQALLSATDDATRGAYATLGRARWGIDEEGSVIRTLDEDTVRIDVSDPELGAHAIETPDPTTLHWRIEGPAL